MLHITNTTITINDSPISINQKLAQSEANAIIEEFERDFGFDLLALPSLDLPLNQFVQELTQQAWINEVAINEEMGFDCSLDKRVF